jgi:hypothetical protein
MNALDIFGSKTSETELNPRLIGVATAAED